MPGNVLPVTIDIEWARKELDQFISLTRLVRTPDPPGTTFLMDTRRPAGSSDDIIAAAQLIDQVLDHVIPNWRADIPESSDHRWQQRREACQRAIVVLERRAEIAEKLGDDAPQLSASTMHPWIWEAARSLWQSGPYREAVGAAARQVNAETQNKVTRRDVSESDLFVQAFSDDAPKPGAPRLRLPAQDQDGKTAKSVRRGVRCFAEGCYAGIRNPVAHEQGELSQDEALEQLAAFSVLARWVTSAKIVKAS
jgi:hypothetical protein